MMILQTQPVPPHSVFIPTDDLSFIWMHTFCCVLVSQDSPFVSSVAYAVKMETTDYFEDVLRWAPEYCFHISCQISFHTAIADLAIKMKKMILYLSYSYSAIPRTRDSASAGYTAIRPNSFGQAAKNENRSRWLFLWDNRFITLCMV